MLLPLLLFRFLVAICYRSDIRRVVSTRIEEWRVLAHA